MDKRERVLGMGFLVKSPTKSKDKARFTKYWKLRWCVFVEILHIDVDEFVEDSKLVLNYYKDKESFEKDEQAKGQLNVSQCIGMKSCHNCPAAFDHTFTMEFTDGKLVWFSAPTCQKKFKWITLLYKHRFNSNIEEVVKMFGLPGSTSSGPEGISSNTGSNRMSLYLENTNTNSSVKRSSSVKSNNSMTGRSQSFRDSSMFSPPDSLSLDGNNLGEAPPLPPRRNTGSDTISIHSCLSDDIELRSTSPPPVSNKQKPVSSNSTTNEFDINVLQLFNDLFTLCETCQLETRKKEPFAKEKRRSMIWKNQEGDMQEVRRESFGKRSDSFGNKRSDSFGNERSESFGNKGSANIGKRSSSFNQLERNGGDNVSLQTTSSDDSLLDPFDPYTKIDEELLDEVKGIQKGMDERKEDMKTQQNAANTSISCNEDQGQKDCDRVKGQGDLGVDKKGVQDAGDFLGNLAEVKSSYLEEEDEYMDMDAVRKEIEAAENEIETASQEDADKGRFVEKEDGRSQKQEANDLNTEDDTERYKNVDDSTNRSMREIIITQDTKQLEDQKAEVNVGGNAYQSEELISARDIEPRASQSTRTSTKETDGQLEFQNIGMPCQDVKYLLQNFNDNSEDTVDKQIRKENAEGSIQDDRQIEIESKSLQTEIKIAKRKVPVPNVPVNPEDLYSKVIRKKSVETDASGKGKHKSVNNEEEKQNVVRKESSEDNKTGDSSTTPRKTSEGRVKDIPAAILLGNKEDLRSKIIRRKPVDAINLAMGTDKSVINETEKEKLALEKDDEEIAASISKDSDKMKEVFEMHL